MEFVALSDTVLSALALDDPQLRRVSRRVSCRPVTPIIPHGLPVQVYTNPELHQWWRQWKYLTRSDITLQAMDNQTCGHYALFFLKARAQGQIDQEFLGRWSCDNLVLNDHKVANS